MSYSPWQLEPAHLVMPNGRQLPLAEIADWAMAAWGGKQQLVTDQWRGWRIVHQWLVPPDRKAPTGGIAIHTIESLRRELDTERRRASDEAPRTHPGQLRLPTLG